MLTKSQLPQSLLAIFDFSVELNFTILRKRATPLYQAALAILIGLTGMVLCRLLKAEAGCEFFAAMVGIIFFAIINTVVSLAYPSFLRYTMPSFYIYIAVVVILFLSAKLFSGISIWTLPIYRNMLTSVTIFYVIIGILVRALRLIYELAEKESQN